ncbi:McrC family protein [Tenacibaculum aiptasiae]|uniref:McrC family protein n=1 Tax=Tenacibaculum aiptasiae TaxID=426481 RepID=UPI00232B18C0|nr:restriction endonuclease [Tenacibaculum aiptasiae]
MKVYEHERLFIGQKGFKQNHLDALLRLNEYHDWSYFKPIANGIQFTQYVGVIQVDGLLIEILPKADKSDSDSKWQKVLLHMLQSCRKLKASSAGAANVNRSHFNLLEVYFELFLTELDWLQHRGLIKQYRQQIKNTNVLKGKLEFAGHIQRNLIHKERFYTTHQVYDRDHLLHQVLYKALDIVERFSKGSYLYGFCKRISLNFPEVSHKYISIQQLNSIKLDRKSNDYDYVLELARLIILNYSPNIFEGKEKMLSLLFDMNVLWEEYILVKLREITRNTDIQIIGQDSKLFWENNSLRPDIVLRKGNKTYIIDTKWKIPYSNKASVEDLRQIYTYCRFWNAEKGLLLYPGSDKRNKFESFQTVDYINKTEVYHQCKMGYVSVLDLEGNINEEIGLQILKTLEIE